MYDTPDRKTRGNMSFQITESRVESCSYCWVAG